MIWFFYQLCAEINGPNLEEIKHYFSTTVAPYFSKTVGTGTQSVQTVGISSQEILLKMVQLAHEKPDTVCIYKLIGANLFSDATIQFLGETRGAVNTILPKHLKTFLP